MEKLFKSFSSYITLTEDLKKEISTRMKPQIFKKGEIVHDASRICSKSYFIEEGMLRLYLIKDGREVCELFSAEEEWINSPKSFMQQCLDDYYIDAIEETRVLSLHARDLVFLFNNFPEMERYSRLSMGSSFGHLLERLTSLRFTSAQEKYTHFIETYQAVYLRIPLGMVASYLGITQETLSRIRSRN